MRTMRWIGWATLAAAIPSNVIYGEPHRAP